MNDRVFGRTFSSLTFIALFLVVALVACETPTPRVADGEVHYVDVQFAITKDGRVEDARALRSSDPGFEKAAVEAVSKWRYNPYAERRENQVVRLEFD